MIVSGTRFLTTVVIGRQCGASELGVYAIGFSAVVLLVVFQESLITTPYTILSSRQSLAQRRQHAGSLLIHHACLAILATLGLAIVGVALSVSGISSQLACLAYVVAATLPFVLLREFARRYAFAQLDVSRALLIDASVAVLQLGSLVLLSLTGSLSAATAFAGVGIACAATSWVWLVSARAGFVIRWPQVIPQLGRNWPLAKWFCGTQLVEVVSQFAVYWLLSLLVSTAATGVYAACSTVVLLANPFIQGLSNVVIPESARAFAAGGGPELQRVVRKITFALGIFLSVYLLGVILLGETIVAWLYDDPAFANHGHLINVLSISTITLALGIGCGHGLKAMGHPQWNFAAGLLDLAVMLLTAVPLAWMFGMIGGAYCLLCGSVVGTATRFLAFSRLVGQVK
jgi:O-antigen/teichoic acid export membrane protein